MELGEFALRVFSISEAGQTCVRIQLVSGDGGAWNTWTAPFAGRDAQERAQLWEEDATRVVRELQQDFPAQDIQLIFVAYDAQSNQIAQNTKAIRGQAKHAAGTALGGPGRAMADSMNALANTMDRVLATANKQMEHLSTALEQSNALNQNLINQVMVMKLDALNQKPAVDPEMLNKGIEMLPQLVEMFLRDGRSSGGAG